MKLTKQTLKEIILEIMNEEWPTKEPEGPKKASTNIMNNPFDEEEKEEDEDSEEQEEKSTISKSKLKKEFEEYELYNKHMRKL